MVLIYLMRHQGLVVPVRQIRADVLQADPLSVAKSTDAVVAIVRHLREKLEENPSEPAIIVTSGRQGYRFLG